MAGTPARNGLARIVESLADAKRAGVGELRVVDLPAYPLAKILAGFVVARVVTEQFVERGSCRVRGMWM